jgi:hypothetical protein
MSKIHFYTYDSQINKTMESKKFEDTAQFREYLRKITKNKEIEGSALDFDVDLWDEHIIEILNHKTPDMIAAHNSCGYRNTPEEIESYFIADSEKGFDEYLLENLPQLAEDKENKKTVEFYKLYFDFEQHKRDSLINDFFESNGFYFVRH